MSERDRFIQNALSKARVEMGPLNGKSPDEATIDELQAELDRLRDERDELRRLLEVALSDTKDYMNVVEERDRLRAENERLRDPTHLSHYGISD